MTVLNWLKFKLKSSYTSVFIDNFIFGSTPKNVLWPLQFNISTDHDIYLYI